MPENASKPQPQNPAAPAVKPRPRDAGHIPITEEMDSAKWTLPPVMPVVIVVVVLAGIVALAAFLLRAKPAGTGAITNVIVVPSPDQSGVMVELHVRVQNVAPKPLWIRGLKATVKTDQGEYSDDAASAVDFPRYFQALPELGAHQITPLNPETKIAPGAQQEGMLIVAFPVQKDQFEKRQSLSVTVDAYDQRPVVIPEKR